MGPEPSYSAQTAQMFGELGYGFSWNAFALEPFAGLSYVHLNTGSANEIGGAAALRLNSASADLTYSTLGLRIGTTWALDNGIILVPRMMLAWQHAYGDLAPAANLAFSTTGIDFSVTGAALARDAALVELGADWKLSDSVKLGVSYRGTVSNVVQDNAVTGVFSWSF
ncbi:MAG TPA: autotransporter domain-containing protein [Xanthobacteraceae bacterium]|nr:autotransporter domain-containing protein [Xanthobacteraceae bacterium]HQS49638.1 autotransporter domain-containing protein [Xanthobacteraceae bacterium]